MHNMGTTPLLTAQAVALSPLEKDASSMRRLSHAHWRRWGHVSGLLHRNDATSPVAMSGCWPQARLRREGGRYGARVGYPAKWPRPLVECSPWGCTTRMWYVFIGGLSGNNSDMISNSSSGGASLFLLISSCNASFLSSLVFPHALILYNLS